ncbi:MAG: transglycosylase SLT domain-containing protein [Pseudomonadota bacterium]
MPDVSAFHAASLREQAGRVTQFVPAMARQALAMSAPAVAAKAAMSSGTSAASSLSSTVDAIASAGNTSYDWLRGQIRWKTVKHGKNEVQTPDKASRLLLVQAAAKSVGLNEVGLGFEDVYGVISAETSWLPRTGMGKNGKPSYGLAQFEPATARALGLQDPNDPVEAVHAAALHLKQAATWSANRIEGLKLTPEERAEKLREGVSIYYNLSSKGRAKWNGENTQKMPVETLRHIANSERGAREATYLAAQLQIMRHYGPGAVLATKVADTRTAGVTKSNGGS